MLLRHSYPTLQPGILLFLCLFFLPVHAVSQLAIGTTTSPQARTLAISFNDEISKTRPDFTSLDETVKNLRMADPALAERARTIFEERAGMVASEALKILETSLVRKEAALAREQLDYCSRHQRFLGISFESMVALEERVRLLVTAAEKGSVIDRDINRANDLLREFKFGDARQVVTLVNANFEKVKPTLSKAEKKEIAATITKLESSIGRIEDSLIAVCLGMVKTNDIQSTIDYRERMLIRTRANREKLGALDEAIFQAQSSEQERQESARSIELERAQQTRLELERLEQKRREEQEAARAQAQRLESERLQNQRAEQERLEAQRTRELQAEETRRSNQARLEQQKTEQERKQELHRQQEAEKKRLETEKAEQERVARQLAKEQRLTQQQREVEAAPRTKAPREQGRPLPSPTEKPSASPSTASSVPSHPPLAPTNQAPSYATREYQVVAQQRTQEIYQKLEANEIIVARALFLKDRAFYKTYLEPEAFSALEFSLFPETALRNPAVMPQQKSTTDLREQVSKIYLMLQRNDIKSAHAHFESYVKPNRAAMDGAEYSQLETIVSRAYSTATKK